MPSNKDRLYIALYARGGKAKMPGLEDTYHWALIIGPKKESPTSTGKRFHAKESLTTAGTPPAPFSEWRFDEMEIRMRPTNMLLARILVAKIEDRSVLESILQGVPVRPEVENWNCVEWVKEALATTAHARGVLGTSITDWDSVRNASMQYVDNKKAAGRFDIDGGADQRRVATWDMLGNRELIP